MGLQMEEVDLEEVEGTEGIKELVEAKVELVL